MEKYNKILLKIIGGKSDFNIEFDELCKLLRRLNFKETIKGSHHIYRKSGIDERINIQPENGKAKAYQIRQLRDIIIRYGLGVEDGE
ncbi:MAG: type II toxin-antitoxin system HicA family toxin [Brevinematales bacterium]|jgi:predicted RNA binding protein YcfA (HicA-like mRNA interferase family)